MMVHAYSNLCLDAILSLFIAQSSLMLKYDSCSLNTGYTSINQFRKHEPDKTIWIVIPGTLAGTLSAFYLRPPQINSKLQQGKTDLAGTFYFEEESAKTINAIKSSTDKWYVPSPGAWGLD